MPPSTHTLRSVMEPQTERLRTDGTSTAAIGVDRRNNVLKGFVVAQKGVFKTGRGEFDMRGLSEVVRLGNASPRGLRSRWGHPQLCSDSLGTFLGRARGFFMGVTTDARTGEKVPAVRADLHLDRTAMKEPVGGGRPRGAYILDLAESDASALSSSLVLKPKREPRLDAKGRPRTDENGEELPPLWIPISLGAADLVDEGDAVDGILSTETLGGDPLAALLPLLNAPNSRDYPSDVVGAATVVLDRMFPGRTRDAVADKLCTFLDHYLDRRFGRLPSARDQEREFEAYRQERKKVFGR